MTNLTPALKMLGVGGGAGEISPRHLNFSSQKHSATNNSIICERLEDNTEMSNCH